jgi:hypothetical protein
MDHGNDGIASHSLAMTKSRMRRDCFPETSSGQAPLLAMTTFNFYFGKMVSHGVKG